MEKSVLVIVDVQVSVMAASVRSAETIENIGHLVDAARDGGVPVVWVLDSAGPREMGSSGWQLVPELTVLDGEHVVDKKWADSFVDTELAHVLEEMGAHTIVLAGAQSDACIRNTFYGGIYRGFNVVLVADAHTTGDLRQYGADYTPADSIAVLNMQAAHTVLPGVAGSVASAAEMGVAFRRGGY